MYIWTSKKHIELYPFPNWIGQTTSLCFWCLHTSLLVNKQSPQWRLLPLGLRMPSSNYKTALKRQNKMFSNTVSWPLPTRVAALRHLQTHMGPWQRNWKNYLLASSSLPLTGMAYNVMKVLHAVKPMKVGGPDGAPGKGLKTRHIPGSYHRSSETLSICLWNRPSCIICATILLIPKKDTHNQPHWLSPYTVAHTPVITRCFEKLFLRYIKTWLPTSLDSYQFAYQTNRSTEDAIANTLYSALSYLERQGSYVRMLFINFSSAFNIVILDTLIPKLANQGLQPFTCYWTKWFLINWPQQVKLSPYLASSRLLRTDTLQDCVLRPVPYSLFMLDCSITHQDSIIVKFADGD